MGDTKGLIPVETTNGVIYANRYEIQIISCLGINRQDFEITSYLFDDPESYQDVIGLDFLQDTKFCIDLRKQIITIQTKKQK